MEYFEIINNHKYLYLDNISEPKDNSLRLVIEEANVLDERPLYIAGKELGNAQSIEITEKSNIYAVVFESYIGYSVVNESYAKSLEGEEWEGRLFRIYNSSEYLNYLSRSSFASNDYPGPFNHYGFNCLNHIVDVASLEQPKITLIKRT